jgi:hypothetical protein
LTFASMIACVIGSRHPASAFAAAFTSSSVNASGPIVKSSISSRE